MSIKLAIIGATGLVGLEMLRIIEERKPALARAGLYASPGSSGTTISSGQSDLKVESLVDCDFHDYDAAFFCVGDSLSTEYVPTALAAGCAVVDKSNAFRLQADVPLVIPGVNDGAVTGTTKLIANPNCTTIILCHALGHLNASFGLREIFAATYQSVAGAGKAGVDKLFGEYAELGFDRQRFRMSAVQQSEGAACGYIAHNVQPMIGTLDANLRCGEEVKLIHETRKILGLPALRILAHSVRVPVPLGHGIAVTMQTERAADVHEIIEALAANPTVSFMSDGLPCPLESARDGRRVLVGRLRREEQLDNGWSMFVCGDNLHIGAALNGWRILELLAERAVVPEFTE